MPSNTKTLSNVNTLQGRTLKTSGIYTLRKVKEILAVEFTGDATKAVKRLYRNE